MLGLFIHRLKIFPFVSALNLQPYELNYLESRDILDHVIESARLSPVLFMNTVQWCFNLQLNADYVRAYRQDCYRLLNRQQPLTCNDFKHIDLAVNQVMTLRE